MGRRAAARQWTPVLAQRSRAPHPPRAQLSSVKRMIEEYEHSRDVTRRVGNVELTTEQHFHSLDVRARLLLHAAAPWPY